MRVHTRGASSPLRRRILLVLSATLAGACGFPITPTEEVDGGGSTPRCSDCTGEDGGSPARPASDGSTVGFLETQAPALDEFILRGTLPIPPHTFPRVDGRNPFMVVDWNGIALSTQT